MTNPTPTTTTPATTTILDNGTHSGQFNERITTTPRRRLPPLAHPRQATGGWHHTIGLRGSSLDRDGALLSTTGPAPSDKRHASPRLLRHLAACAPDSPELEACPPPGPDHPRMLPHPHRAPRPRPRRPPRAARHPLPLPSSDIGPRRPTDRTLLGSGRYDYKGAVLWQAHAERCGHRPRRPTPRPRSRCTRGEYTSATPLCQGHRTNAAGSSLPWCRRPRRTHQPPPAAQPPCLRR